MIKFKRKFYVQLSSGEKFTVSEIDYNKLCHRIHNGKTNGWYTQRGKSMEDSRVDWQIAFKDIASVYSDRPANKDVIIKDPKTIDVDKYKPADVGKVEEKKDTKCPHNWDVADDWIHVTTHVGGVQRYYKQCVNCGAKSQLVKKREVELSQEALGETLDTVPLVE